MTMKSLILSLLFYVTYTVCSAKYGGHRNMNHNRVYESDENRLKERYNPSWEDLDRRPLPEWYDQAKIGIFVHWGVYSVPAFIDEWFWKRWADKRPEIERFMKDNYRTDFKYRDFAPMFQGKDFNPDSWADLFAKAGARYVVLTTKHHDGFTLFPSKQSPKWNSVVLGPQRDIVKELSEAVLKKHLRFGAYYSLYEWFHPLYVKDKKSSFTSNTYCVYKMWPEFKQLVETYKPSIIWSDGDWDVDDRYWNSTNILSWLYNESPVKDYVVVNDRWGNNKNLTHRHGDFYNVDDRFNPRTIQKHKWENAFTIDKNSWGYRQDMAAKDTLTIEEILENVVSTVSCGGNVLINVGPTKEGVIVPIFQERLLELGKWLKINGGSIYGTSPCKYQRDSLNKNVWYTCIRPHDPQQPTLLPLPGTLVPVTYAITLKWPDDNVLIIKDVIGTLQPGFTVDMIGETQRLTWETTNDTVKIKLPTKSSVTSTHAWVLKFYYKNTNTYV